MNLKEKIKIFERSEIVDDRGSFLKVMFGNEFSKISEEMEIYMVSAKPKKSRGGHYHKFANEWFTLLTGECHLFLEDVNSKQKLIIKLNSSDYKTIYVPPYIAHEFYNPSKTDDFLLLAYTDKKYVKSDTLLYKLI